MMTLKSNKNMSLANTKCIYLSYILGDDTPGYGGNAQYKLSQTRSICCGDTANNSYLEMSVHHGTHIDLPYHFFKEGQTIESYPASFWVFNHVAVVEILPKSLLVCDEVVAQIKNIENRSKIELLLIKTGMGEHRGQEKYWNENVGLAPELAKALREQLPSLRVVGFDSISLTSYQHREVGRDAHKKFLNPNDPILILEDMDLSLVNNKTQFEHVQISPLRIGKCDGLPCTVTGVVNVAD